jgi:pimeloyl-ACP methyl ester carboxylesterase
MRYKEVFMAWFNIWMSEEFRNWNIENALKSIPVPILVIQGEKDPYGTIKQVNSIVQNASGFVKELLLPNIGHAPHKESKLEVINHVTRFIHEN